jgi:hypothetical protein
MAARVLTNICQKAASWVVQKLMRINVLGARLA